MRTRMPPHCTVRQYATPEVPFCSVGVTDDQSVVPKGMSVMCIAIVVLELRPSVR